MISTGINAESSNLLTIKPLISTRFSRRAITHRRQRWGAYTRGVITMADNGYNRNLSQIKEAAQQVVIDLSAKMKANVGVMNQTRDLLPVENESQPADPIYPDDLIADIGVEIEPLPDVPEYDPKKQTNVTPQNPQAALNKQEQNINAYMEADQRIKSEFLAELNNVDPEVGAAVEGAMPIPGGSSGLTMLGSLADDAILPGAGDIWRAIDDIMSQSSNPNSERVQAAISQTIVNLQSKVAENVQQASNTPGAPKPIRWDKLDPDPIQAVNQIQNFLMRDPKQDPLMQTLLDNEPKLAMMQQNWDKRQEFEAGEIANVELAAIERAVESGDRGLVKALVQGDEADVDAAMQGDVEAATKKKVVSNTWEIDARMKPSEVSGIKTNDNEVYDLDVSAKDLVASLKIADPKIASFKPDMAFA
jgi:hypothetical protein